MLNAQAIALKAVEIAQSHVGEGRNNDRAHVANCLGLFDLPLAENGVPVAYCAAEVAFDFCAAAAELTEVFYGPASAVHVLKGLMGTVQHWCYEPSASVALMVDAAQKRGNWLDADAITGDVDILPGWIICFDWGNGEHHTGIVRKDKGDIIGTVEGNTTLAGESGMIADKERDWSCIWGYIKTYEPAPAA